MELFPTTIFISLEYLLKAFHWTKPKGPWSFMLTPRVMQRGGRGIFRRGCKLSYCKKVYSMKELCKWVYPIKSSKHFYKQLWQGMMCFKKLRFTMSYLVIHLFLRKIDIYIVEMFFYLIILLMVVKCIWHANILLSQHARKIPSHFF